MTCIDAAIIRALVEHIGGNPDSVPDGTIGGVADTSTFLDATWETDDNFYKFIIETRAWTILRVSGVKPGYRAYHSMNFFKRDTLIIFGGKTKTHPTQADYTISDGLIYVDLKMLDCSTPFIGDLGPCPRFGHKSAYNAYFNKGSRPFLHCIVGGLHNNYCGMDIYCIKEVELNDTNKWVYVQKNMHSAQKIDGSDEVFETAKKTIIQFKKKLEEVTKENIQVNKIYAEYFQTLNRYNKTMQEENFSSNEKKSKLQDKKIEIENLSLYKDDTIFNTFS